MSAPEIVDWFAESGAQPGSITYQYAEKVLRLKEREAEEDARSYKRAMRSADEFVEELKAGASESSHPTSSATLISRSWHSRLSFSPLSWPRQDRCLGASRRPHWPSARYS